MAALGTRPPDNNEHRARSEFPVNDFPPRRGGAQPAPACASFIQVHPRPSSVPAPAAPRGNLLWCTSLKLSTIVQLLSSQW